MSKRERAKSFLLYGVMVFYFVYLLHMLFVGFNSPIGGFGAIRSGIRGVNIIPFYSIAGYLFTDTDYYHAVNNLLGNVVTFIPLGIYITLLRKNKGVLLNLLFVFLFSVSIEIAQFIFARGVSDIDDVLLNSLGGLIGILCFKGLVLLLKNEEKARSTIAVLAAIVAVPLLFTVGAAIVQNRLS